MALDRRKEVRTDPITDPEEAVLFLYRTVGHMRSEKYREHTSPAQCLINVDDIGAVATNRTKELFHSLKEKEDEQFSISP